ncbi:MAG: hypothetical protein GF398_01880, partial [Chitinivibrionales bacterium]|nr:hypothetical protein [Chitinivibrionales bacterium]
LGFYALAVRIADLPLMLPTSVILPALPAIFSMKPGDWKEYGSIVIKTVLYCMFFVCSFIFISGHFFVPVFYGKEFAQTVIPLNLLLPGIFFSSIYRFFRSYLFSQNKIIQISIVAGIAFAVNVVINVIYIPIFGIAAAAVSSSICYTIATLGAMNIYCRYTNTRWQDLLFYSKDEMSQLSSGFINSMKNLKLKILKKMD